MKQVIINEESLNRIFLSEDVFVGGIKGNEAKLTYNKRSSDGRIRNMGNYSSADMLGTAKMDKDDPDTYIVPLKGGINSYNITSIRGTEVMHYFKNKFMNRSTNMSLNVNGEKREFKLYMEDEEFRNFMRVFCNKVSNVVNHVSKEISMDNKNFKGFKGLSIYPVPSSSNFNISMANVLVENNLSISGLKSQVISTELFKKDLTNLQKDEDFIAKNREYYEGNYLKNGEDKSTHIDKINDTIRKYNNTTNAQDEQLIDNYNNCVNRVITSYYTKSSPKTLAKNYVNLVNAEKAIRERLKKSRWENAFNVKKYAKGPSIDKRTKDIQGIVASVLGKTYVSQNNINIVEIEKKNFQIKNLTNDIRMGLKNYFAPQKGIEEELEKIKGTVFVIFDDNVSGGATLSDICFQAKKLGIEYIIPITFGEMNVKYSFGTMSINKPEKWNF